MEMKTVYEAEPMGELALALVRRTVRPIDEESRLLCTVDRMKGVFPADRFGQGVMDHALNPSRMTVWVVACLWVQTKIARREEAVGSSSWLVTKVKGGLVEQRAQSNQAMQKWHSKSLQPELASS
jgi:hypothetical protein